MTNDFLDLSESVYLPLVFEKGESLLKYIRCFNPDGVTPFDYSIYSASTFTIFNSDDSVLLEISTVTGSTTGLIELLSDGYFKIQLPVSLSVGESYSYRMTLDYIQSSFDSTFDFSFGDSQRTRGFLRGIIAIIDQHTANIPDTVTSVTVKTPIAYTGSTGSGVSVSLFNSYTGTTAPNQFESKTHFNSFTGSTPIVSDNQATVSNVFSFKSNVDNLAQGTITLTNGSAGVVGTGTNFLDATTGRGLSYWYQFWVKDSSNNWHNVYLTSISNATNATIASVYTRAQVRAGFNANTSTWPGVTGTYQFYITRNWSDGLFSIALGSNAYADNFSTAIGSASVAVGQTSLAGGFSVLAGGTNSIALGRMIRATGSQSFAGGKGANQVSNQAVIAAGQTSFNYSETNTSQTAGHGALGANSVILGGLNHNVPSDSPRSVVLGGNTIKATASTPDTVFMPKVRIGQGIGAALTTGSSTNILARNVSTGEIEVRLASTLTGATYTANNGLTKSGTNFRLGGTLTGATNIDLSATSLALSNGNVVIGTTSVNTNYALRVRGIGGGGTFPLVIESTAGANLFYVGDGGEAIFPIANVGIGTPTPSAYFSTGTGLVVEGATANNIIAAARPSQVTRLGFNYVGSNLFLGGMWIDDAGSGEIKFGGRHGGGYFPVFYVSGSEVMRIDTSTKVKISSLIKLSAVTNSSPEDGDLWREDNTNTGWKVRVNGVTKTITLS